MIVPVFPDKAYRAISEILVPCLDNASVEAISESSKNKKQHETIPKFSE